MLPEFSLQGQQLACRYGERTLFKNLNFSLVSGQYLQVVGKNGAGKTSLLRMIAGLKRPTEGQLHWQLPLRNDKPLLIYIGHQTGIRTDLTLAENLKQTQALYLASLESSYKIEQALARFSLQHSSHHYAKTLSAGQQRRLSLAKLLIIDAPLWILDEPFAELDQAGIILMEQILTAHLSQGGLCIFTSHFSLAFQQAVLTL